MGSVKRFNLKRLKEECNANYFFETGTWKGDSVAYAAMQDFKEIISSEIVPEIAERARKRFENDKRIIILESDSISAVRQHSSTLSGNCIFWLDAHFPGSEEGLQEYNSEEDNDKKYPLRKELEAIYSFRKQYSDVILVDDLRIYEINKYQYGNMPDNIKRPLEKKIDFVYDMFNVTHDIFKSLTDEGYIYALPKNRKQKKLVYLLNNIISGKLY